MRKKKTFMTVLLLLTIMLAASAQNAYNPYGVLGATSKVDYDRITEDYSPEAKITFYVGELTFEGFITNSKAPYGVNEISRIIKDVMNEMGITEGMLDAIDNQLSERNEITSMQWDQIAAKVLDIVLRNDINPLNSQYAQAMAVYNSYRQGGTVEQALSNGAKNLLDMYAGKKTDALQNQVFNHLNTHNIPMARATIGKKALGWLLSVKACSELGWNISDFLNKIHLWDREEYLDRMLQRELAKKLFYDTCKHRLCQALEDYYADGQWELKVDDRIRRDGASLFTVPISQVWNMEAKLQKQADSTPKDSSGLKNANWKGRYVGRMKLEAIHDDLNDFDENYQYKVILSRWLPFRKLLGLMSVKDACVVAAKLGNKILESDEVTLTIREKEGERKARFIAQLNEQPVSFMSNHRGDFKLELSQYKEGELNLPHFYANVKLQFDFSGGVEGEYGRKVCLYLLNQTSTDYAEVFTPEGSKKFDLSNTVYNFAKNGKLRFMVDNGLFKPLEKESGWIIEPRKPEGATPKAVSPKSATKKSSTKTVIASKDNIEVYDWLADMPEAYRKPIELGNSYVAKGQLPEVYRWVLPEGLLPDDDLFLYDDRMTLSFKKRKNLSFQALVDRMKGHGYQEAYIDENSFLGSQDEKECSVSYIPANDYILIDMGTTQVSEKQQELNQITSKLERMRKRLQEITQEIQTHPERAEELQREMIELTLEMQDETLKLNEIMLNQ